MPTSSRDKSGSTSTPSSKDKNISSNRPSKGSSKGSGDKDPVYNKSCTRCEANHSTCARHTAGGPCNRCISLAKQSRKEVSCQQRQKGDKTGPLLTLCAKPPATSEPAPVGLYPPSQEAAEPVSDPGLWTQADGVFEAGLGSGSSSINNDAYEYPKLSDVVLTPYGNTMWLSVGRDGCSVYVESFDGVSACPSAVQSAAYNFFLQASREQDNARF